MDLAPGPVSLLRFENNLTDATGNYNWTNVGPAPYSAVIFAEGSYSIGPFSLGAMSVTSDEVIGDTLKTFEFYFYYPAGGASPDDRPPAGTS